MADFQDPKISQNQTFVKSNKTHWVSKRNVNTSDIAHGIIAVCQKGGYSPLPAHCLKPKGWWMKSLGQRYILIFRMIWMTIRAQTGFESPFQHLLAGWPWTYCNFLCLSVLMCNSEPMVPIHYVVWGKLIQTVDDKPVLLRIPLLPSKHSTIATIFIIWR